MAVRFDASGEHFTRSNSGPSAWTMIMWVYPTSDTDHGPFGYGTANAGGQCIFLSRSGTNNLKCFDLDLNGGGFGNFGYTLNSWSVQAISASGANVSWYHGTNPANLGVDSVTNAANPSGGTQTWFLGIDSFDAQWWRGRLAAVKIYTAQLTAAEIAIEASQYAPRRTANLVQWHHFVKTETVDYSGSGNTLTGGTNSSTEDGPPIPWRSSLTKFIKPVGGASTQTVVVPAITASSTVQTPSIVQQIVAPVITTSSSVNNPQIIQIVQSPVIAASSVVLDPVVVNSAQIVVPEVINVPSTVQSPKIIQIVNAPVLSVPTTVLDPSVVQSIQVPVIEAPSSLFDPSSVLIVQIPTLNIPSTVNNPTLVNLLQIITLELLQAPSSVYNPSISGEGVYVSLSISDQARVNMLADRSLSEPQLLSNIDLMRLILDDAGQTLVTETNASSANQYWQYLKLVRDS